MLICLHTWLLFIIHFSNWIFRIWHTLESYKKLFVWHQIDCIPVLVITSITRVGSWSVLISYVFLQIYLSEFSHLRVYLENAKIARRNILCGRFDAYPCFLCIHAKIISLLLYFGYIMSKSYVIYILRSFYI